MRIFRSLTLVVVVMLLGLTAVAQDAAAFPAAVQGFSLDAARLSDYRQPCEAQGGSWQDPGTCTFGGSDPREVTFESCSAARGRRTMPCRIGVYPQVGPAEDRAAWAQRFARVRAELAARFGAAGELRARPTDCLAPLVERGDPSCVLESSSNAVTETHRFGDAGRVTVRFYLNFVRRSPAIAILYEDRDALALEALPEARTPH